ncbi:30S ribosomal protein S2 [Chitinispirillales bacterium ANBcel5]|uniref:30S ribosomal protein S2 n=1 Tax=Cellulosispirillum alkaliphilum TaxID=3039283 RepID=UPI002A4E8E11|nr:30S ribosomal protein S2 [Chitinispirillales bacterium ANBcel5]
MENITLQDFLDAGTHFGHQTKRWNPKMKRFILCPKNGIYIIDLNKTQTALDKFIQKVKAEVKKGGNVLFVGTKKQLKDCIREEATRCNMPYVTERWLGGMLTNFQTIRQSIAKLDKIESMEQDGTMEALPKKERVLLYKRKEKLISILSGIRHVRRLPSIIFVVDTIKEHIAIAEGKRLQIPIGAIVDTNCDPDIVDFPIPGNDDAIKSVQLITRAISDAILEESKEGVTAETMKESEKPSESKEEKTKAEQDKEGAQEDESKTKRRRVVHKKFSKTEDSE